MNFGCSCDLRYARTRRTSIIVEAQKKTVALEALLWQKSFGGVIILSRRGERLSGLRVTPDLQHENQP